MPQKILFFSFALCAFYSMFSCNTSEAESEVEKKSKSPIWKNLREEFQSEGDEIYSKSIDFLEAEMPSKRSNRVRWVNPLGDVLSFHTMEVNDQESLMKLLNNGWQITKDTVSDLEVLSRLDLSKRIRLAIDTRSRYQWNKNIPDSIFLRYVLPYKIIDEYPEEWRSHYFDILSETLDTLDKNLPYEPLEQTRLIDQAEQRIIETEQLSGFWSYNPSPRSFNKYPSLSELYCFHEGTCYYGANLFNYQLRASGIPTTVDEIPFWGSVNGQHAFEVVYDPVENRFSAPLRHAIQTKRPAKVIRRTFHREGKYSDDILELVGNDVFPLSFLKNDYWYDSTSDHCRTTNVSLPASRKEKEKGYGLIYAMNYGRWMPIYFGKVIDSEVVFSDMGTDVIYRVGYFERGTHHFTSPPFLVTTEGEIEYPNPDYDQKINISVPKINHGELAQVEEGAVYKLLLINRNGEWETLEEKKCTKEGNLTFQDVPSEGYYFLESPSDRRNLARIFKIGENGDQIWY
ncbi:hypothetical protein [Membranihabitans maritimus]|uniref:hypothetical protein n=1 Tax=Membranihabitans maritimus TaxID=2904244 RepID=UPI001F2CFF16|nr:hypothetical protein [Membranihabitans maritimus]